jgi:hypothetical protein
VIELLAVTDAAVVPGPPLRTVRRGRLSAVCGPSDGTPASDPDALWRREELVEELMAQGDVLPVRFGTVVADEQAVARALDERHDELTAGLERVRGAVELAVRAQAASAVAETAAQDGRGYLRARIARTEEGDALHAPLAAAAREAVRQGGPDLLRAAYLVDRDRVATFTGLVREIQERNPACAIVCTGPWPPYSFVGAEVAR